MNFLSQRILTSLQGLLNWGPSTFMCTQHPIAVHKSTFDGIFLGSHVAFLKGARQLHPSWSTWNLVWELPRVLKPVRTLLEPAQHVDLKWVSLKMTFLLAITAVHVLAISSLCMRWRQDESRVTLWLNLGYLPKVISPNIVKLNDLSIEPLFNGGELAPHPTVLFAFNANTESACN